MNITSFNNVNNCKNNISNNQSFKGLWGKTSTVSDVDTAIGVWKVQDTYYYHPYSDESLDDIKKVVSENSSANLENDYVNPPRYMVKDCRVCATLPFTEGEYNQYKKASKSTSVTPTMSNIHQYVANLYTTNSPTSQASSSARNMDIEA